jgi:hypothetical protein
VGGYGSGGVGHGLLFSDGDFTQFDLPGATFTTATRVNSRGDIVGRYTASGVNHAFLLSAGRFSTIDFPGATYTGCDRDLESSQKVRVNPFAGLRVALSRIGGDPVKRLEELLPDQWAPTTRQSESHLFF